MIFNSVQRLPMSRFIRRIGLVWNQLNQKFQERLPRERYLLIAVAAVLFWVILDALFLSPQREQRSMLGSQIDSQQRKLQEYQGKIGKLPNETAENPNVATQREIDRLNTSLSALEGKLGVVARSLIAGDLLFLALEDVLNQTQGLVLQSLHTLPMEKVFKPINGQRNSDVELFKHSIQLKVQGNYFPIVQYLKKLEALPYHFYWEKLDYRIDENGIWGATLEVYTLSMDSNSLGR